MPRTYTTPQAAKMMNWTPETLTGGKMMNWTPEKTPCFQRDTPPEARGLRAQRWYDDVFNNRSHSRALAGLLARNAICRERHDKTSEIRGALGGY